MGTASTTANEFSFASLTQIGEEVFKASTQVGKTLLAEVNDLKDMVEKGVANGAAVVKAIAAETTKHANGSEIADAASKVVSGVNTTASISSALGNLGLSGLKEAAEGAAKAATQVASAVIKGAGESASR
ncbi:MAG: hypothetical protein SFT92_03870 [Rickettsiales bacterium]|nr:hypothetical protein [Rickettsiales bacterium]